VRDIKQCVSDHKCLPKEPFMTVATEQRDDA